MPHRFGRAEQKAFFSAARIAPERILRKSFEFSCAAKALSAILILLSHRVVLIRLFLLRTVPKAHFGKIGLFSARLYTAEYCRHWIFSDSPPVLRGETGDGAEK